MEVKTLKVKTRQSVGKSAASSVRAGGQIPCVLYGGKGESVSLLVDTREFHHIVHGRGGEHAIVNLEVEGNADLNSAALLKAVQHDPIRGAYLHADFLRIRLDERITTIVPVRLAGQPKGVVDGGVLDFQVREVEIDCLAVEVPAEIVANVATLGLGDSIHAGQLQLPSRVVLVTDPDRTIAAIHVPRAMRDHGDEEGDEGPATPEVINEKKREGK